MLRTITSAVLCVLLSACAGCGAAGALAHKFGGNDIKAQYVPARQPLLVLVERDEESMASQEQADRLAMLIEQRLAAEKVAPVVDGVKLMQLRTSMKGGDFAAMPPADKGQKTGAAQVLWVRIKQYQMHPVVGGTAGETLLATVRLLDAKTGAVLFPGEHDQRQIMYRTSASRPDSVLEGAAARVAALFHDVER